MIEPVTSVKENEELLNKYKRCKRALKTSDDEITGLNAEILRLKQTERSRTTESEALQETISEKEWVIVELEQQVIET